MKRIIFIAILIVAFSAGAVQAGQKIKFTYQAQFLGEVKLSGELLKPDGNGPFGAVVLLHGCSGIHPVHIAWAERIKQWGYVALVVDSLGPRGFNNTCDDPFKVSPTKRALDAWGALAYLAKQPYVDPKRIALIGFSHGGVAALAALQPDQVVGENRFRAAVAVYPYCGFMMDQLTAPLLILIGGKDEICPCKLCEQRMPAGRTKYEVKLKIYPGVHHAFINKGLDATRGGKRLLYDPKAAADAIARTKEFLAKYLR